MYYVGIDLGGTNIAAGIVNEKFEILHKDSTPTLVQRPNEEIVADMGALVKKIIADAGLTEKDIEAVGVVSPGVVDDKTGYVLNADNMGFKNFPLVPLLKTHLSIDKIYIENDANAAALGEAVAGAAKGARSSVMITLGTGVGGGIVDGGKLYKGFNSAAGELGHIVIEVDGRPCSCGRRGCWEAYSSATGLINMTKEKLEECKASGRATKMTDIAAERGKVTGRTAFDAMRMGDEAAREVVNTYVKYLAAGLVNMINVFQPEVLSIGGGISNEGQFLLDLLKETTDKERFGAGMFESTELRIAQLRNDAGIIGAAILGM
jgi:glucokinase